MNTASLLQQKTAQLAAVREISRAIAEAQDLDATLDLITRRTAEVMGVDSCSIYLYNKAEDELVLAASTGLRPSGIGRVTLSKGTGLTGWAAEHGEIVAVANAKRDPRFYRIIGSGESRFGSLMAMPLTARGKVIGAANAQTADIRQFSDEEIELFSFITDLAATALEKARLVHAAVVQEIHHRVKNNLQTIAMLLRLQVAQADALTPEDILHETINRVLSIAAVHEILAQEHHSQVSIKRLLQQIANNITTGMTMTGQVNVAVIGDDLLLPAQLAANLALIANELIQNALEHGLVPQHSGQIRVKLKRSDMALTLTVADKGRGLPPGFELDSDQGLGLELVQTLVEEDLGGTFSLASKSDGGTEAVVCVPVL
ncbi:MAG TPA: GAF domain-containing protein [Chloroflexi bacterium]|nr:GAF domain-containing protein [Chloroflexota bacterium]